MVMDKKESRGGGVNKTITVNHGHGHGIFPLEWFID